MAELAPTGTMKTPVRAGQSRSGRTAARPGPASQELSSEESIMADLAPPATMKSPVRAALRGRPGLASQELFSEENSYGQTKGCWHPVIQRR